MGNHNVQNILVVFYKPILFHYFFLHRLCSGAGSQPGGGVYSSTASAASNHSIRLSMSPYSGFVGKLSAKEDESKFAIFINNSTVISRKKGAHSGTE